MLRYDDVRILWGESAHDCIGASLFISVDQIYRTHARIPAAEPILFLREDPWMRYLGGDSACRGASACAEHAEFRKYVLEFLNPGSLEACQTTCQTATLLRKSLMARFWSPWATAAVSSGTKSFPVEALQSSVAAEAASPAHSQGTICISHKIQAAQHSTAQHSTAQHSTAQHSTAQHSIPTEPETHC